MKPQRAGAGKSMHGKQKLVGLLGLLFVGWHLNNIGNVLGRVSFYDEEKYFDLCSFIFNFHPSCPWNILAASIFVVSRGTGSTPDQQPFQWRKTSSLTWQTHFVI